MPANILPPPKNKREYVDAALPKIGSPEATPYPLIVQEAMAFVVADTTSPPVESSEVFVAAMQALAIAGIKFNRKAHFAREYIPAAVQMVTHICEMDFPSIEALSELSYVTSTTVTDGQMDLRLSTEDITTILCETFYGMYLLNIDLAARLN